MTELFKKQSRLALLAPAIVAILVIVAACGTPDSTPTPSPPTPTPSDTPTPTPTPTPTATATPSPPTPTPTPLPPTPTPTLAEAVGVAEKAMVKLRTGGRDWTGVMIGEQGRILTTSSDLRSAPIAEVTIADGTTSLAWVIGRDDALDFAMLEIIDPVGTYDSIGISEAGIPLVDSDALLLQYLGTAPLLDKKSTRVIGIRQDLFTGLRYIQLQGLPTPGTQGGAMIDNQGRLQGIRMTEEQMIALGVGRSGETYAIDSAALVNVVIPRLESGVSILIVEPEGQSEFVFPPIAATFNGDVVEGGVEVAVGQRMFANVIKAGVPDLWFSEPITKVGRYFLSFSISKTGYTNADVEFWLNATKAPQSTKYVDAVTQTTALSFD
ncbi:MAG: serine protease [Dehalococcoidia bacterium]